jgi:hypothetical protein
MDGTVDRLEQLPEDCGGYVAQDGTGAAGQHRRHEAFTEALRWVSEGVDALVNAVKLPFANADRKRFRPQAARFELPPRNRPMLPSGNFRSRSIRRVEFCVHMRDWRNSQGQ